jgi:hypothetical protein
MTRLKLALCVAVLGVVVTATVAVAGGRSPMRAELNGYNEVPLTISSPGNGTFRATIDRSTQTISYRLTYADLPTTVQQAHIHFGRRFIAGGISAFLCTNLGNGPAGTQACPPSPATVTGTIGPADVVGPAGQGIAAGEFDELADAMRSAATYANVHTTQYPAGEIRGQIGGKHGHGNGDRDDWDGGN